LLPSRRRPASVIAVSRIATPKINQTYLLGLSVLLEKVIAELMSNLRKEEQNIRVPLEKPLKVGGLKK
jgi:hypothetical protein